MARQNDPALDGAHTAALNRIGWAADQLATALNPKGGKRDLAAVFKADEALWKLLGEVEPADSLEGVPHADKLRREQASFARALGLEPEAPRPRTAKTLSGWSPEVNHALGRVHSFAGRIHQAILDFDPDDPANDWTWPDLVGVGLLARSAGVLIMAASKAMGPPVDAPLECLTKPTGRAKTPARAVPADGTSRKKLPGSRRSGPAPSVNARMLETIQKNPDALGWKLRQWTKHLKCGKSTVAETPTWTSLGMRREQAKAERARDRRRKPKASDQRRQ